MVREERIQGKVPLTDGGTGTVCTCSLEKTPFLTVCLKVFLE